LFLRGILDVVVWRILGPVLPALATAARDEALGTPTITAILRFSRVISVGKILFGAFAFVSAWQLLRLRRPARVAMQVVAYVQLVYFACFAAFWSWLWPRVAASRANDPSFPSGRWRRSRCWPRLSSRRSRRSGVLACAPLSTPRVSPRESDA
jgi:hypothetical protein